MCCWILENQLLEKEYSNGSWMTIGIAINRNREIRPEKRNSAFFGVARHVLT